MFYKTGKKYIILFIITNYYKTLAMNIECKFKKEKKLNHYEDC